MLREIDISQCLATLLRPKILHVIMYISYNYIIHIMHTAIKPYVKYIL